MKGTPSELSFLVLFWQVRPSQIIIRLNTVGNWKPVSLRLSYAFNRSDMIPEQLSSLNDGPGALLLKVKQDGATIYTKLFFALLSLIVVLFAVARLWNLAPYNLWGDELFSLYSARMGWVDMIRRLITDGAQAPVFYVLLKGWIAVGGESVLWLRLLPVVISIITLPPFFLLCRALNLRPAEVALALLLISVNGYLIYYAQEIRPYSLLVLMTVCSLWLFVRFFKSTDGGKSHLVALVIVNTLLVYTHYFGWLVIATELLFLGVKKRQRLLPFAVTVGFTAVLFAPWAYAAILRFKTRPRGVGQTLGWIPQPRGSHLLSFVTLFTGQPHFPGSRYLGLILFGGPVLLWTWHVLSHRDSAQELLRSTIFWLLSLLSFLPVVIAFVWSQVSEDSVWVDRYLIIIAVPLILLVSIAFLAIRPNWLRNMAVLILVIWAGLAGFKYDGYSARTPWGPMMQQMMQAEPGNAKGINVYVYKRRLHVVPIRFYLQAANAGRRFRVAFADTIDEMADEHFWVAGDLILYSKEVLVNDLVMRGYHVGEGFEAVTAGKKIFLFPVWLDEDTSSLGAIPPKERPAR
jgi:hypothetical protein